MITEKGGGHYRKGGCVDWFPKLSEVGRRETKEVRKLTSLDLY